MAVGKAIRCAILSCLLVGCASTNRMKMSGTIANDEIYFDGWVAVKIVNAPEETMLWVRLNKKQLEQAKTGTNVIFYVHAKEVHNEGW